jgi:hypothetical protein
MNLDYQELKAEIEEKSLDLNAFVQARDIIRARVLEVKDSPSPLTPLPNWSGTDAVLGSLDLAIHSMERTLVELSAMLDKARPPLQLVKTFEVNPPEEP